MTEPPNPPPAPWPADLARPMVALVFPQQRNIADLAQALDDEIGARYTYVPYSEGDPTAYGRALSSLWPQIHDLIIIGPDTVVTPGSILSLARCTEPWCVMPDDYGKPLPDYGLGFAKFSAGLQTKYPTLAVTGSRMPRGGQDYSAPADMIDPLWCAQLTAWRISRHHHNPPTAAVPGEFHG